MAGDIVKQLRDTRYPGQLEMRHAAADEIEQLRDFIRWIDTWISNPARAYSHDALEGLFGMTRDRMPTLPPAQREGD